MTQTQHLFENGTYYISNHSVALNGMFLREEMQTFFLSKMEYYLDPICQVMAYNLEDNSFELVVRLKDREAFVKSFLNKRKAKELAIQDIPDSTYIFSQAMANLQVSFVKHFNYFFGRSGTLMAGRFFRNLVESEEELGGLVERLNNRVRYEYYRGMWIHKQEKSKRVCNSKWMYDVECAKEVGFGKAESFYSNINSIDLGGIFEKLPPKRLESTKNYFIKRFNLLFGPNP